MGVKKNRLYILDLDNCLIFSSYNLIDGLPLIVKRKFHFLYHRPHLTLLLNFVFKTGDVIFYTSSKMEYAKWVVNSFNLNSDFQLFSRKYCRKKYTEYSELYFKSIDYISLKSTYDEIIVIDDRIDFWHDNEKTEFFDIPPFMGEKEDDVLKLWVLNRLKKQPKI